MIRQHFSFIKGVSPLLEAEFLKKGLNWDSILSEELSFISKDKYALIYSKIKLAKEKLAAKDHTFFAQNILSKEHFRLYDCFYSELSSDICYLDIETTGLSKQHSKITTISTYDGKKVETFIHGKNLDENKLCAHLNKYKMFVTFNGICFDMPFISHQFPSISFSDKLHMDLRFVCRRVGLTGGLKRIEKEVGIVRDDDIKEVDGFEAVRLWRRYEQYGDIEALQLLIKYNQEDVINLKTLAKIAIDRIKNNL